MMTLCDQCRGACCEDVELAVTSTDFFTLEWLSVRGELIPNGVRVESRCPKLTESGACSEHASLGGDQPIACRLAVPGELWCLDVIKRRRPELWDQLNSCGDNPDGGRDPRCSDCRSSFCPPDCEPPELEPRGWRYEDSL